MLPPKLSLDLRKTGRSLATSSLPLERVELEIRADVFPRIVEHTEDPLGEDSATILRHKDQVHLKRKYHVTTPAKQTGISHRPS